MSVNQNGLEIAVIGLSGRFPGGKTIADFWKNLQTGVELVTAFPNTQPADSTLDSQPSQPPDAIVRVGAVLQDVDQFDAAFFGFNPREAEAMDPQHRLFLEAAWEALENAGYSTPATEPAIGVFAGVGMGTYLLYNLSPHPGLIESRGFLQTLIGVDKDYLPTRVSYKLDLKGPSISVGTACSSSLVAVHLACQSLLSGECDLAVAAGVAVKVPQAAVTLSPDEIVSPDGHCRAFDSKANGTVGGNGLGVVVLKRLDEAIADRDHIYAVIKGSAINNDGAMKVGYTAPSQEGQASVIRAAQRMAEVAPETISYVETHGTGTALGDPIEIAAMTQAFRSGTERHQFCAIGSVKTNVGHLDAAAGITGLIKTVLALYHQQIPPSLHFESANTQIDFANSPFYVNTQLTEWKTNGTPRRAGVSSFGFGGTNAHVVLEAAPAMLPVEIDTPQRPYQLLALSAKTATALAQATMNLRDRLQDSPSLNLADVAYTLQVGRWAFAHRRIVVAQTLAAAVQALASEEPALLTGKPQASEPAVIFMFPGQGSQSVNMARALYASEPTFQQECDRCFALLQANHGIDLHRVLYPQAADLDRATDQLTQTAMTQPALFVIEYALAKLWISWGVKPRSLIGHSLGEYVAACLAKVFSLQDALALVVLRGHLMQQQPPGTMLAVHLSASELQPLLPANLSLAANNSPSLSVVSGAIADIEILTQQLAAQGIDCRRLQTSHAFHSPMMDSVLAPFTEQLRQLRLNPPQIPFISNVTGTWITAAEAIDPLYWAQHLRQPVQFAPGIAELLHQANAIFLEVGPGTTLSTLTKQQARDRVVLASLPAAKAQQHEVECLLQTLGQLWLNGVPINWSRFYAHHLGCRVPLPTYPFERQRYWIDPPHPDAIAPMTLTQKRDIADWFYLPSWKRSQLAAIAWPQSPQCWVMFADRQGLATAVTLRLRQQGQRVIEVNSGREFSQPHPDLYILDPRDQSHYDRLISAVLAGDQAPIFAHFWTVTADLTGDEAQTLGFYSLLYLAQALGQQTVREAIPIAVVSSQIQEVTGAERICPEKATVLGACQVIPQEYANLNCCHLDVVLPESEIAVNAPLIDQIIGEILTQAAEPSEAMVAYRGNYRWLPTHEPIRLAAVEEQSTRLRSQGVYLITGGLGGIGLALAEYLATQVQAKLGLISRSPLPPRAEWAVWLTEHADQDANSRKIRKIQALEAIGAEVLVLSADVADRVQMQAAVDRVQQTFGTLHGIFQTAGVAGEGIMQLKTPEMAAAVMRPKVQGTLVLSQICQNIPLDFMVLFSSHSAILGGLGQVDYCAANCFLDAWARSHPAQRVCSINWDIWQEIGMGANLTELPDLLKQERLAALETGIAPAEGLASLQRILQSGYKQVLVSTKDWQTVRRQNRQRTVATPDQNLAVADSVQLAHSRSLPSTDYAVPSNEIEQQIAALWQSQLGIAQVGVNDNFFELGGHSLLAVRVVSRLREQYPGVELSLRTLLSEAPTIAGLAHVIASQLAQPDDSEEMAQLLAEIEQLSSEEVQAQLAQETR